ncbi:MAG TPA: hypothetical protein VK843_17720 [Planctomycetota bacterium]|nr:hypothetical protein [Planctomycetota bacterium]
MNTWTRTTLGLLFALSLAACQTGRVNQPQWVETTTVAPSEAVIWNVALLALQEQKFPIGAGVDPAKREAITGWRNSLAPFKSEGYRQRVLLRLEPLDAGKYKLLLHVEKDTNEELAKPMELAYAQWEEAPDDIQTAQILISKIEARLGGTIEIGLKSGK